MPSLGGATALWALVTGVPEPRRSSRLLLMLQALVDESESFDRPALFVLAGYIATVERWAQLTARWQEVLSEPPRMDYFSYKEAFPRSGKPRGQFNNLTIAERDAKVGRLRSVIEQFAQAEISIAFGMRAYKQAFAGISKMANNPYHFATTHLMVEVGRSLQALGFERGPLDFIFDERKTDAQYVLEAWFHAAAADNHQPSDLFKTVLTNAPMFRPNRGENGVIALQAADMLAGWFRSTYSAHHQGGLPLVIPGTKKRIRGFAITFDKPQLAEAAALFRAAEGSGEPSS